MREIKFRAFVKDSHEPSGLPNNSIYKVADLDFQDKWATIEGVYNEMNLLDVVDYKDCEIMQFTGLTDKRGVEIYEGDVIKIDDNIICFCEFLYGSFMLNQGDIRLNLQFYNKSQIEVIGNIHQNPELLK